MDFQSYRSPNLGNFGIHNLGVLGQINIWVPVPWPSIDSTIMGKVVVPPSPGCGEFYESMFAYGSSAHQKCSNYALTNLLLGLCRSVWVIDLLVILPSPYPGALTHPSTLKVLQAKEHTPTPHSSTAFTFNSHLSLLRNLGVHQCVLFFRFFTIFCL
jgi:hypothetical protein